MAQPNKGEIIQRCSYDDRAGTDGVLTGLVPRLASMLRAKNISLDGKPNSKQLTLYLRHGAKRIFYVRLIRKTGRCLVEMGGMDPQEVLGAVRVCRDHFDHWFGIEPEDIRDFESRRRAVDDTSEEESA